MGQAASLYFRFSKKSRASRTLNTRAHRRRQKVASEEKIGGLSFNELMAEISSLQESKEICAVERTENCLHRLIMVGAEKDIVISSDKQFMTLATIANRLDLAGRNEEAEAFKNKIVAALPEDVTKDQYLDGYASVLGFRPIKWLCKSVEV